MQLPQDGRITSSAWASPQPRLSHLPLEEGAVSAPSLSQISRGGELCASLVTGASVCAGLAYRVQTLDATTLCSTRPRPHAKATISAPDATAVSSCALGPRPTRPPSPQLSSSKADSGTPGPRDFQTATLLWEFLAVSLARRPQKSTHTQLGGWVGTRHSCSHCHWSQMSRYHLPGHPGRADSVGRTQCPRGEDTV